jgi:hypothetical protein
MNWAEVLVVAGTQPSLSGARTCQSPRNSLPNLGCTPLRSVRPKFNHNINQLSQALLHKSGSGQAHKRPNVACCELGLNQVFFTKNVVAAYHLFPFHSH